MNYRDTQKSRHAQRAIQLFGDTAGAMGGTYLGIPREFCLPDECSSCNLHEAIRAKAISYFKERTIPWHDGLDDHAGTKRAHPSNHTCCSQSQCVNFWFPYRNDPDALKRLLDWVGYDVEEVLPIAGDHGCSDAFVAFEWIGVHNYLGETTHGRRAECWQRTRGANFTSADFVVRFRERSGAIHLVLGEWKYTEEYAGRPSKADTKGGRTRLRVYEPHLSKAGIRLHGLALADLLYEPFYQMLRLQLLACVMEHAGRRGNGEMGAERVSVLHVAPEANRELVETVTSPNLRSLGDDIYDVWEKVNAKAGFRHVWSERLGDFGTSEAVPRGHAGWADWYRLRYI